MIVCDGSGDGVDTGLELYDSPYANAWMVRIDNPIIVKTILQAINNVGIG